MSRTCVLLGVLCGLLAACKLDRSADFSTEESTAAEDEEEFEVLGSESSETAVALLPKGINDDLLPTIKVTNITRKGELYSSLIVGSCLDRDGIRLVEVKVDEEPYRLAEGSLEWKFRLPVGEASWRKSEVHAISIRCSDTEGSIATTPNLVVRQGSRRDINGDGFPDLVVGAPSAPSDSDAGDGQIHEAVGRLYLVFGTEEGFSAVGQSTERTDGAIAGEGAFWRLGSSVALGDFDGDGYADLAASEPGFDGGKGRVVMISGRRDLVGSEALSKLDPQTIEGHSATGSLGVALTVVDLNKDGFDDLLIAQSSSPGRLFLFHGSSQGLGQGSDKLSTRDADATLIGSSPRFGSALVPIDYDRDGAMDLIVGEPGLAGGGRVSIFAGGSDSLWAAPRQVLTYDDEKISIFGERLAAGDFDGDQHVDIAVSLRRGNPEAADGRVVILSGKTLGSTPRLDVAQAMDQRHVVILSGQAKTSFGASLATTELAQSGASDLLVGAPHHREGFGRVYVFGGSTEFFKLRKTTRQRVKAHFSGVSQDEHFGTSISAGVDYNHDGQPDLAIGSPRASTGSLQRHGRVYLFYASDHGFATTARADITAETVLDGSSEGLSFGASLP